MPWSVSDSRCEVSDLMWCCYFEPPCVSLVILRCSCMQRPLSVTAEFTTPTGSPLRLR